jgi:hypothetical protein
MLNSSTKIHILFAGVINTLDYINSAPGGFPQVFLLTNQLTN